MKTALLQLLLFLIVLVNFFRNIIINIRQKQMKKYLKFIKRDNMPTLELEDKKMPMTQIIKSTNSLRFIHPGQGNQVSAARTAEPLSSSSAVVYFQAFTKSLTTRYEAGVGIIQKDCALKRHPGQSNMSIGYLSSGQILINGKKTKKVSPYKSKSVVGIGIIYSKLQVFFTLDGNLLQTLNFQHNPATWPKFYPCVSLRSQKDQIELRFKNFSFNFQNLLSKVQEQCIQQIQKQKIENSTMYSLVGDYLKFHGYKNTFNKLKQSSHFQQTNVFVEHPFWEPKLKFFTLQNDGQNIQNLEQKGSKKKMSMDEQIQQQLVIHRKNSTRQRIMSDYWGDILPSDSTKKRTSEQKLLLESRRKSSVISNNDHEQNGNKNNHNKIVEQSKQDPEKLNQKQKFLFQTRIQTLKLIREQKIQQALELLKQSVPQLFEVLDYLQAYFYMHVYIKTLKNEGACKAMLYMKKQSQKFKKYKGQLYPIYCKQSNRLKFVQFTHMMGLVSLKPGTHNDVLTSQQFYAFSNYVNELILKNMGLFPESRLDTLVNHLKCINSKSDQYQINGLSFVCDI